MTVTETYHEEGKVGVFYSNNSIREALDETLRHVSLGGFVASLPYLARLRCEQPNEHWVWQDGYDCVGTEEDVFVDEKGEFSSKGLPRSKPLVAIIHGGGLALEKLKKGNIFSITNKEVITYIKQNCGELVYTLDDVLSELPPRQLPMVILATSKRLQQQSSGTHDFTGWTTNELVIARSLLSLEELQAYFKKTGSDEIGNWHKFVVGQGRVPCLSDNSYVNGFYGSYYHGSIGRPVGVAVPEAPQRAREWLAQHRTPNPEIELPIIVAGQLRQPPIFVPNQGYISSENVPKTEPKQERQGQDIVDAVHANVKQNFPELTEAQQEARADIVTRFKGLEID